MAGRITQESLQRLNDSVDIVDLISSYIDVRKEGANFMALCPFHDEKTPSFSISPNKGLYHCFGCGASGNGITFVMNYEHLGFIDAVEKIAQMFHIPLERESGGMYVKKSEILPAIAAFYHNNLFKNEEVLNYLLNRKISLDSIKKFQIGYSGLSFETISFLDRNDFSQKEALEYGILSQGQGKDYARFTKRVMFPIHSKSGVCVGFGGRILESKENTAKYLNSPQSKVFNKSKILYGYDLAKVAIHKENSIIICEGYLDVVLLHQAGFSNAVATLGTAFNEGHLSILNRDNPRIIMCYDGDKAGINAAIKAAKFLAQNSKDGGVVILQNGLDPADMIAQGKVEEFRESLKLAKDFVEFVLESIIYQFNLSNPMQKQAALNECKAFLHTLSPLLQDAYKEKCAIKLGINPRYIKLDSKKAQIIESSVLKDSKINIVLANGEAEVLINMLLSDEHFFFGLNFLHKKYFRFYSEEFELISQGKKEDSKISALQFKHNVKIVNHSVFKDLIRGLILQYARDLWGSIRLDSNLSAIEKQKKLQNLNARIETLQKGEIVSV